MLSRGGSSTCAVIVAALLCAAPAITTTEHCKQADWAGWCGLAVNFKEAKGGIGIGRESRQRLIPPK
jgi:hypothetical protein